MKLVEATTAIVTYLRENVTSPHASGNWIYTDYPRMDVTFPRISVTQISGSLSQIAVGEKIDDATYPHGKLTVLDYDIDIWVKVNNRATFDSTIYVGTKLRDYLVQQVIQKLEEGKTSLKSTYGIIDIEVVNISAFPLDLDKMLHRKTVTIRISFIWKRT